MADTNLRVVDRDTMDRSTNDKSKALEAALSQIERAHGKGSIMKLGEGASPIEAEAVSTGSIGLDIALGIGGVPKGRIVEIYGPESSGKTTLALHIVAEAQRGGLMALKVTQLKSNIGCKPKQRGTLRALGLRGIGRTNTLPDRPEIRGMIARVPHLVSVEEVED